MKSAEPKYPLATLAPYGPNDKLATKLVVAVFPRKQKEPAAMRKWFVDSGDVRENADINEQVTAFLKEHNVANAVLADRILGCPHEEGVDYPLGGVCPVCPFWAGRNRFTHQKETRVGRNDPCPCGSGKKYKKCCGAASAK
jgi:uncharacterized protein YecA (UPF0149 family)